jgi:hypothetical protein
MVQVTTKTPGQRPGRPAPGLRVEPTEDKWRRLKHPSGAAFRSTGTAEWPNDDFTRRRIRAGSIRLVENKADAKSEGKPEASSGDARPPPAD